ncbi:hypothetical protein NT2_02_01910 [Caenibius tardaugens NBRC 16725]|uniref:Glycosyltransferase RgtA/B/C/D-like domain-containing protein n=1 Tax=Caenibius tardaugens NBRC 16725 TaxID=1219035 RepID=U2ZRW0_9SPHN|nr:glycosyltransferase family 39 protein [Caenibius tardaugens]AZI34602.1 hypothetical protein EGO55_00480 [Caenibius tardaugens NBRC 16725]GAD48109.1 hypothetical protein NT2_02_01910 [Caenibius tardaugens NBRC 16725]
MASISTTAKPALVKAVLPEWLVAAAVILFFTALTRFLWFGDPIIDFDEQLYSFVGWRMTQGELPFVDLWDRKPFGLFALFAIAHGIGGPGPAAYQVMASLFAMAGSALTYILARDLAGRLASCTAAALYLLFMALYGSYGGQSEIFHVPLMVAMALLVRDPQRADAGMRTCGAMLLGGLALQIKYTVLPQCLFFGLYALWGQFRSGASPARLARIAAVYGILGVLPTALVALFYLAQGHLDAFVFANFLSFFDRMPSASGRFDAHRLTLLFPLLLIAAYGVYTAFPIKRARNMDRYLFHIGWMVAAFLTVVLPATVYPYYYGALVPPAILVATPFMDRASPLRLTACALLVAAIITGVSPVKRLAFTREHRETAREITAAIAPYVGRDRDCLYVFDGPVALYRLTDSCVPSRFVYPDHLNNKLEEHALGVDQAAEVARIFSHRPGAVVTASRAVTPQSARSQAVLHAALRAHYTRVSSFPNYNRRLIVWIRNDKLVPTG